MLQRDADVNRLSSLARVGALGVLCVAEEGPVSIPTAGMLLSAHVEDQYGRSWLQNIRPFADDVKFAEHGSKSFKTVQLKVEAGTKIVQYSKVPPVFRSSFSYK